MAVDFTDFSKAFQPNGAEAVRAAKLSALPIKEKAALLNCKESVVHNMEVFAGGRSKAARKEHKQLLHLSLVGTHELTTHVMEEVAEAIREGRHQLQNSHFMKMMEELKSERNLLSKVLSKSVSKATLGSAETSSFVTFFEGIQLILVHIVTKVILPKMKAAKKKLVGFGEKLSKLDDSLVLCERWVALELIGQLRQPASTITLIVQRVSNALKRSQVEFTARMKNFQTKLWRGAIRRRDEMRHALFLSELVAKLRMLELEVARSLPLLAKMRDLAGGRVARQLAEQSPEGLGSFLLKIDGQLEKETPVLQDLQTCVQELFRRVATLVLKSDRRVDQMLERQLAKMLNVDASDGDLFGNDRQTGTKAALSLTSWGGEAANTVTVGDAEGDEGGDAEKPMVQSATKAFNGAGDGGAEPETLEQSLVDANVQMPQLDVNPFEVALRVSGAGCAEFNGEYALDGQKDGRVCFRKIELLKRWYTLGEPTINFSNEKQAWYLCQNYKGYWYKAKYLGDRPPTKGCTWDGEWEVAYKAKEPGPTIECLEDENGGPEERHIVAILDHISLRCSVGTGMSERLEEALEVPALADSLFSNALHDQVVRRLHHAHGVEAATGEISDLVAAQKTARDVLVLGRTTHGELQDVHRTALRVVQAMEVACKDCNAIYRRVSAVVLGFKKKKGTGDQSTADAIKEITAMVLPIEDQLTNLLFDPLVKVLEGCKELCSTPMDIYMKHLEYDFRIKLKDVMAYTDVDNSHIVDIGAGAGLDDDDTKATPEGIGPRCASIMAMTASDSKKDGLSVMPGTYDGHWKGLTSETFLIRDDKLSAELFKGLKLTNTPEGISMETQKGELLASLTEDGVLEWSNGDIWHRIEPSEGQEDPESGAEITESSSDDGSDAMPKGLPGTAQKGGDPKGARAGRHDKLGQAAPKMVVEVPVFDPAQGAGCYPCMPDDTTKGRSNATL